MPWGVDDIQAMAIPLAAGCRRLNGDAALLLLLHKIGGRGAVVHLADLMNFACQFQNSLGGGGLAGVNVGKNADVSVQVKVCHELGLLMLG